HQHALQHGNLSRLASCGRASPVVDIELMDDDGQLLPSNEVGEIVLRGDLVMKGYHRNPESTASTVIDGWLHTGDIGYRDEDGFFYIVDRKKDMIITGGFNIYPNQIEQVLLSHASVA